MALLDINPAAPFAMLIPRKYGFINFHLFFYHNHCILYTTVRDQEGYHENRT